MRSKLLMLIAAVVSAAAVQGCGSSDPPKSGVPAQMGDYRFAPGGGSHGGPTPGQNPNKG